MKADPNGITSKAETAKRALELNLSPAQRLTRKALILLLTALAVLAMIGGAFAVSHARAQAAAKPVAQPIHSAKGGDVVVKIFGRASGCDAPGTKEDQTVQFVMDPDGTFHAEMAAGSIAAFSDIAGMTGVLRTDGSFHLTTSDGRGDSTFNGAFDKQGHVSGTWTETNPDTKCTMTIAPLSSWFYFGVTEIDWHTTFGVRS